MKLRDWIRIYPVIEIFGKDDVEIGEPVSDSRKASPGALFVALAGTKQDGRKFISDAIDRGAAAVVMTDRPDPLLLKKYPEVAFVTVSDARRALPHLAAWYYEKPAASLRLIGVTGTNGKTTTTFLIYSLLRSAGFKPGLLGTIRYDLGGRLMEATHTTPGPPDLHRFFAEMRDHGVTHVAMEVSSHALDQGRVADCSFETAVFTNLTQDHLDYHGTMASYFASKRKLFDQTAGRAVINVDDPYGRALKEEIPSKSWSYGIEQAADLFPKAIETGFQGTRMTVQTPMGAIDLVSPLVGRYNASNLLAATGAGMALGLPVEAIREGIASMSGVPGRFEKIDLGQDFTVLVDYAHTEDALARLLQAVSDLSPARILTVFGCGGDRDRGKRPKMGAVSGRLSTKSFLTSDNPRSEPPLSIIQEIEAGMGVSDYEVIPDRREAIARAIALAGPGDAVVIAGKGHENYQIIQGKKLPFDDREVARTSLAEKLRQV